MTIPSFSELQVTVDKNKQRKRTEFCQVTPFSNVSILLTEVWIIFIILNTYTFILKIQCAMPCAVLEKY